MLIIFKFYNYEIGGELFEYILAHRYLEEYEAKKFFAQLLSGINYLHKNHLVHRDLKLVNKYLNNYKIIIKYCIEMFYYKIIIN